MNQRRCVTDTLTSYSAIAHIPSLQFTGAQKSAFAAIAIDTDTSTRPLLLLAQIYANAGRRYFDATLQIRIFLKL